MNIKKNISIFKIFLIFIIFFNCLLFRIEDAFSLTTTSEPGPRDRVRKFNELKFSYVPINKNGDNIDNAGFSCRPYGLKYMDFNSDEIEKTFGNINEEALGISFYIIVNLLFFPILCTQILTVFKVMSSDDTGILTFLIAVIGMFGLNTFSNLEEIIFEDDFNMESDNIYCIAVSLSILTICIAMMVFAKLDIKLKYKIPILVGLDLAANIVREAFKAIQFAIADAVFDNIELCGDNWLTYGDETIEYKLSGLSINAPNKVERNSTVIWDNWQKYVSESWPSKGAFNGSYKYKLNKCFMEGNLTYCTNLYGLQITDIDTLSNVSNLIYKPYREFFYDGIEFLYTGCSDPRPDRKSYIGIKNNDKIGQLYYFKGNESANFACDRFLVSGDEEYKKAYKCCLEASQKIICIHNTKEDTEIMCNKDDDSSCKMEYNLPLFDSSFNESKISEIEQDYEKQKELDESTSTNEVCNKLKEKAERDESCGDKAEQIITDDLIESRIPNLKTLYNLSDACENDLKMYCQTCAKNGQLNKINVNDYVSGSSKEDVIPDFTHTIKFKIRKSSSESDGTKYCVETYNLCPYNFRILGGTEKYSDEFYMRNDSGFEVEKQNDGSYTQKNPSNYDKEFTNKNNCEFDQDGNRHCNGPCFVGDKVYACYNKPSNFCQIDRHCVTIQPLVEEEKRYDSVYIDQACVDNVGSSHNFLNYERQTSYSTSGNTRLLVAPIVECINETFKNILFNRAGHTICQNLNEFAINDDCSSSSVLIKRGQTLTDTEIYSKNIGSFATIRNYLRNLVKALMVLSVVLYGYNIILFKKGTAPEEFLKYILTLIFVAYFSFSDNWINTVFNSIYSIYNTVTELAVKLLAEDKESYNYDNPKYSGCFFFDSIYINNKYSDYKDRKYIAVFDTFDCKISRYFGYYTNSIGHPPIISIFIMGIFSAGFSILVMMPFILLFISLLFFAVRVAYIFVVNSLTITILLFMAPIFIPMILFERTKGFFSTWLRKLAYNVMSPLFIFMSLSLFFVIFDKYYIADAMFYGQNEPIRSVYCGTICKISETNYFNVDTSSQTQKESCSESKGTIINLRRKAPICATQDPGISNKTGITILDFLIENFPGLPGLANADGYVGAAYQIESFFTMFFNLIFLLILVFIFEQFISYVISMAGVIFSSDESGNMPGGGIDDNASGLPSLQKVNSTVASIGARAANSAKDVPVYLPRVAIKNHKEKKKKEE